MFLLFVQGFNSKILIRFCCRVESLVGFKSLARCFASTDCLDMFHCRAETELGHVTIYAFKLIGIDCVGFVPNAYTSICANCLIEFLPCLEMWIRWLASKSLQVFERAPVLNQNWSAEVPEE